jgi:hypothetical protein
VPLWQTIFIVFGRELVIMTGYHEKKREKTGQAKNGLFVKSPFLVPFSKKNNKKSMEKYGVRYFIPYRNIKKVHFKKVE